MQNLNYCKSSLEFVYKKKFVYLQWLEIRKSRQRICVLLHVSEINNSKELIKDFIFEFNNL